MNAQHTWRIANRKQVPNGYIADILLSGQAVAAVFEADGWRGFDWAGDEVAREFDHDAFELGLDMYGFAAVLMSE
jgi:hypothetical protein